MELQIGMPVAAGQADRLPPQRDRRADRREGRSWPPRAWAADREGQGPEGPGRGGRRPQQAPERPRPGLRLEGGAEQGRGRGQGRRGDDRTRPRRSASWTRPSSKLAEQALEEHTIRRPVRRDRHRADEEPRRERPGQRGGRPPGQPRQAPRRGPTSRSSTPTASRKGRSSRSSPGSTGRTAAAAADREEEVPRQDHLRRPADPARWPRRRCGSTPSSRTRTIELLPGLKARMTIYLAPEDAAAPAPAPATRRGREARRSPPLPR